MSIQVQIQVCRACLKPADSIKLEDFNSESDVMKNYLQLLAIEVCLHFKEKANRF